MAQHVIGQIVLADFSQLYGGAHIGHGAQRLPVGRGKSGAPSSRVSRRPRASAASMPYSVSSSRAAMRSAAETFSGLRQRNHDRLAQ
ncbi:hypothetical protein ACFQGS_23220 [Novosphingobium lubricantis]